MLVCSVVLRAERGAIAAGIIEAAEAADNPTTGIIFATITDAPGNALDILDAFSGQRMVEAASAAAVVDALSAHPAVVLEEISAAVAAQDSTISAATIWATWDTATVSSVTLSGGNLIATNTGKAPTNQGASVAAANAKTTGKYYFEATFITITGGANLGIGVGTTSSTYANLGNSATTGDNGYQTGAIWANGSNTGISVGAYSNTQIAGVAVDLAARKIWFRHSPSGNWNNNASYNPATNTGGITIPAGTIVPFVTFGGSGGAANNVIAANFGASAFSGAVPSGFTAGWPIGLSAALSISGTPVTTGSEYEHGVGSTYAGFTVTASGGTAPYTYSVASGTLPSGITLNASSGAVSGTPAFESAGTYSGIVIRATDAVSATANLASFTLTIDFKDPYYSNVRALFDYDAANGSTTHTDQKTGATGTASTGTTPTHSTTNPPPFGTSSLLLSGSNNLQFPQSTSHDLGASSFTIDFAARPASVTGVQFWFGKWGTSAGSESYELYTSGSVVQFNVSTDGTNSFVPLASAGGAVVINTWARWRVDYDGTKYRLYKNGTMLVSATATHTKAAVSRQLAIGSNSSISANTFLFNGNCRGIRLTIGSARTASDSGYTTSNRAFPTS